MASGRVPNNSITFFICCYFSYTVVIFPVFSLSAVSVSSAYGLIDILLRSLSEVSAISNLDFDWPYWVDGLWMLLVRKSALTRFIIEQIYYLFRTLCPLCGVLILT